MLPLLLQRCVWSQGHDGGGDGGRQRAFGKRWCRKGVVEGEAAGQVGTRSVQVVSPMKLKSVRDAIHKILVDKLLHTIGILYLDHHF